jgi:regulator of protease activity HflC (stomatin/prohibitin superfamily)
MLFLKYLFLVAGYGLFGSAGALVLYDVFIGYEFKRFFRRAAPAGGEAIPAPPRVRRPIRLYAAARLVTFAVPPILLGLSIIVVPDGMAGVRISQISGVRPGTLYPGVHFIAPLVDRVALFDVRDHVFTTSAVEGIKKNVEVLEVEAREGLSVGLAVVVRYRIDPQRLAYIQANLPQPLDEEIVAPVVTSVFRDLAPNYIVREVFSTKRGEFRERAAGIITNRLASDGIVVKEVLLRQVWLPAEYARGLEGLLLKEQEDERTSVEANIEQKRVKVAEFQAEAAKIREVKRAEADAQSRVIQAKAESDAMKYTLPLKQKQIEQSRLEAQARKEATVENAEAEAQAKVIDSKAELERRKLFAEAEANRIRLTSAAEAEQMRLEGIALHANPLLIQKIIAERLSDKVRIMMVPMDGKFFFANDVLKAAAAEDSAPDPKDPPKSGDPSSSRLGEKR